MTNPVYVIAVVEGLPDMEVARALIKKTGLELYCEPLNKRGKGNIDKYLSEFNNSAKSLSWLVVRDMDHDADCPPELKTNLLPNPEKRMCFCIAVREIESWLMADSERFAKFMSVPEALISKNPESLGDPKSEVIRLAKKSTDRNLRLDMIPEPESIIQEGPAYASRLAEFASNHWRPIVASKRSESLGYCIKKLKSLKKT